jgi:TRAP-type C4-dicarboxylate transport system substrate-binding protein
MLKKTRWLSVCLILILAVVSVMPLASCSKAEEKTFVLKLAHFFPATHPAESVLVKGWSDAVKEATDGRVVIESYPGESLAKAADIYNGVVEGVADIGLSCFAYTPGRFPVLEAFELPGVTYLNSRSASMVAWEGIKALNPAEVQDTHLLMVIATGPGDLFTKAPVRTLADLQGMEIRATGISAVTIKQLGGVPVGMPQSETYDALSKGVVKGNLSPVEVLKGWKHAEVTQYITETPFLYNTLFFITMNKSVWESIPADLQKTISEVTEKFHEETGAALWDMQNEAGLKYAVDEQKMEVIPLSAEETALWIETVKPIQEDYKTKLAGLGITSDPLKTIYELADQYNELYK